MFGPNIIKIGLVSIIRDSKNLSNVVRLDVEFFSIHLSCVVPFIHLLQGVVEFFNLWKDNLGLQGRYEGNLPTLSLNKLKEKPTFERISIWIEISITLG